MKRSFKRNGRNVKSRFLLFLLAQMLLIPLSAFGYAQWNHTLTATAYLTSGTEDIEITAWHIVSTNSYDVNCNEEILGDELKIQNVIDENGLVGLEIIADPIFPDWHLELAVEIHNAGDIAVYLSSEIRDDGGNILTEAQQLWDLFKIVYTDGFYLHGTDGEWLTGDDEPVTDLANFQLWPFKNCYKLERLVFDGQDFSELQGQSFTFHVIIYGSTGGP